jgi:hypothetical protein
MKICGADNRNSSRRMAAAIVAMTGKLLLAVAEMCPHFQRNYWKGTADFSIYFHFRNPRRNAERSPT